MSESGDFPMAFHIVPVECANRSTQRIAHGDFATTQEI